MFSTGYGLTDSDLPSFDFLLDGQPASPQVAAVHLGVTRRTMANWQAAGDAPRAAKLALFYETKWGRGLVEAQALNDCRMAWQTVGILERENAALLVRVARLERIGGFGCANEPSYWQVSRPALFTR
jgi:hypothetical protein